MRKGLWGSFLLAAIVAIAAPVYVNAVGASTISARIRDNSSSPQFITVTREITNVKNYVNAYFVYELIEDVNNPDYVFNLPSVTTLYVSGRVDIETNTISGTIDLDFSEAEFSKLGDYKFILREIESSDNINYPIDENHEYYIYVSVRNELNNNIPTGRLVATLALQARNHDEGEKANILFTNDAVRTYIEISKTVTGNLADVDEYFKFIVNIDGELGDQYQISGLDGIITYHGEEVINQPRYIVWDDEEIAIYLKHGQTARIGVDSNGLYEIPINITYTVEEVDATDYSTTVDEIEGKQSLEKYTGILLEGGLLQDSNHTDIVNHKESEVLTGITLAIIPAVIMIVMLFGGALIMKKIKKNSNKR